MSETKLPKAPYALCEKCPFKDRDFAATTGPADAKIAVVSRSPGHYEAMHGKSFAGLSGKVLDHLLALHGQNRESVLATNVVLCQSDSEDKGFGVAQACCEPRLESEIADCETVIAAGSEAVYGILQEHGIAYLRGYEHKRESISGKTQRVIVTNNPAVVVRGEGAYPEMVRDFRLAISPLPKPKMPQVRWTEDFEEAVNWANVIDEQITALVATNNDKPILAVDIEGNADYLACVGFSLNWERAAVFGLQLCQDDDFLNNYLKPLLTRDDVRYLWWNGKYDVGQLRKLDIHTRTDEDGMLLSWALDERPGDPESGAGGHSLEWVLKDELGWDKYEPYIVREFKKASVEKKKEIMADKRNRIDLYQYNGMDTAGTLQVFDLLKERAINDNVYEKPYKFILLDLSEALIEIESYGTLFDEEQACNLLESEVYPKLRDWRQSMRAMSELPKLNPNSPKQMGELLYDSWGLKHGLQRPKIERKGKRSVDQYVRDEIIEYNKAQFLRLTTAEQLEAAMQFVRLFDDFKLLDKQRGAFFEGLVKRRAWNGRIYTRFSIHGTESGRLSSRDPNLQNVTRPKAGMPSIRSCFLPDPGCIWISGDLSQAELRTIAYLSGDEALQQIYLETGRSLHKEVAAKFYGEDYTYEQYVKAKNINFGVAYWQSAFSFAQLYNMPQAEAQAYIDFWWERFPKVKEWTHQIEKQVLEEGELQSPFGHKRRFYIIPADQSARLHIIKQGINFKPQNIAGNITLWALIRLVRKLDPRIAQVRISVHDSILVNCRHDHVDEVAPIIKYEMEQAVHDSIKWDFPFLADITVGHNWGEMSDLKVEAVAT